MKTVFNYIKEALVNHKVKVAYKYSPQTKEELKEAIKTELDKGNTDLNCIDTSKIIDMRYLFDQEDGIKLTKEQQETLDISNWNMFKVKDMQYMFYACEYFNSDISNWDVFNVTNMSRMFLRCKQFNSDLSNWDVSNLVNANDMFSGCEHFNCDISNWDVSKVKSMPYMFYYCERFDSDLSNWDVSNVENMRFMFEGSGLDGNEPSWYKKYI